MVGIVFAVIFALIALVMIIFGVAAPKKITRPVRYGSGNTTTPNYAKWGVLFGAIVPLIIGGGIIFLSGFNTVPVKSVGVITSFGKVQGEYGPGAHWLFPTKSLNIVQDTIQSDNFTQANGAGSDTYSNSGATGYCITVRLGGQQEGCADVQLQTRVNQDAVAPLYADYSSYGPNLTQDIDRYVVKRDLTTALNRVLGDYNPVQDVSATLTSNAGSQFSQFDTQILTQLRSELGGQVTVDDVNLQYVHYDSATQTRINQISTQYAETQVAQQQEKTNVAISAANAALAKNNTLTPQVLANECYTTTQDAIKDNYDLPASWNCSGNNSSLLVQGK
jgi:regulator of protease activity HflC (stomatin/prohibitin superfamily)